MKAQQRHWVPVPICLEAVLMGGQSFTWARCGEESFSTSLHGGAVVSQGQDGFWIALQDEGRLEGWLHYFDAGFDYAGALAPVMDAPLKRAVAFCPNLRLLQQPFFETLCGLILSSNNNVARITKLMAGLMALSMDGEFPSPGEVAMAGEERLRKMGMGYRAPYIIGAAKKVEEGFDYEALKAASYDETLRALTTLPGVGPKVADCVMLFSLAHREAFPVDVWMVRAMQSWYTMQGTPPRIAAQARAKFGPVAGIAQNFLFHYARSGFDFKQGGGNQE